MFRRLPHTLPKDPFFPADLEALGYFINDNDQIRQIQNPDRRYQYRVNRDERVNEVYRQSMNTICYSIVDARLATLGMRKVRLPLGACDIDRHLPIYVSPNIGTKNRVVVLFGERNFEPTIFSYRVVGEEGIAKGSCLNFVDAVLYKEPGVKAIDDTPGLVITNPSQLLWYRGASRAVTQLEWQALPRKSAVHEPLRIDGVKNKIPHNADFREHVTYIFEKVLPSLLKENVQLDIIGLEWTGTAVLEYLCRDWPRWQQQINAICFGGPQHNISELQSSHDAPPSLVEFISRRCRAYFVSDLPLETHLTGRDQFGCNRYASGEELYQENVIIRSWGAMLDWFRILAASPSFSEPEDFQTQTQDHAETVS